MSNNKKKEADKMMSANAEKQEYYANGIPKNMKRNKYNLIINKRLREVRNRRGLSLKKVVDLLAQRGVKMGVSTLQGYEVDEDNSNHRYPSQIMLTHLVNLYDCSIDFIFGISDEMERPSNDLNKILRNVSKLEWNGEEISEGQKALIMEKIEEIMSL